MTTVPTGTLVASIATGSGPLELTVTSGTMNAPVGDVATGAPPMLMTRSVGIPVGEMKRPNGVAVKRLPPAILSAPI